MLLAATMTRHRYTRDPEPVIDELRRIAGDRSDILGRVAGGWVAHYRNADTRTLADALAVIAGASVWIEESVHQLRNVTERRAAAVA